jgi:FkbM family methyltransferase
MTLTCTGGKAIREEINWASQTVNIPVLAFSPRIEMGREAVMVRNVAKHAFNTTNQLFGKFSLQLATSGKMPSWAYCLNHIKTTGFRPKTIFDVGIARGTEILYQAFPDAFYYLIDPSRESLPYMEEIKKRIKAKILNYALSDRAGEVTLNVPDGEHIGGSSIMRGFSSGRTYKVKTERLDALVGDFDQPSLCKIDVQGAAMLVLEGMGGILPKVDVFIIESNVFAPAGDDVHQIMAFLGARKFVLYDIADVIRRPLDNALGCLDLVFVKEDSRFRQEKRW